MSRTPHRAAIDDRRGRRGLLTLVAVLAFPGIGIANEGGEWQPLHSMEIPRQETGIARVGDVVYVVGGLVASQTNTTSVEAYDLATGMWSQVAPLPVGLDHVTCDALDGLVYVAGGYRTGFNPEEEVYVYDPVANSWSSGPDLPERRGAGWMVAHDGKLYHFGGLGPGGATATTYILEPGVGWSIGASMPTPREHTNAVLLDGFMYVIGGRAGPSTDANERYDPVTDTWDVRAAMPTARSAMAMAALDGLIYCAGGEIPQLYAVHEVYDPVANAWSCREPMAIPRHGVAALALEDRIFVPAGGVVQGLDPTAEVDVYVPPPLVAIEPHTAPITRRVSATPNPFRRTTRIAWDREDDDLAGVTVHDVAGRLVRTLRSPAGAREAGVEWDGLDASGLTVAPGVYVLRVRDARGLAISRVVRLD